MSDAKEDQNAEIHDIDVKDLRIAVADAAGVSGGLWLSYIFFMLYLIVATGSITHRDLLLESRIKLPFLSDVDLPLKGFFWLGPLIFLVVHAYVLLHLNLLADKARLLNKMIAMSEKERTLWPRKLLPANLFVQLLAGPCASQSWPTNIVTTLITKVSVVIGPVLLLMFFELKFLPYHDEGITWLHRLALVIDIGLLWMLWPSVIRARSAAQERMWLNWPEIGLLTVVSLSSFLIVFALATFPGEWLEQSSMVIPLRERLVGGEADELTLRPPSLFPNRLILPSQDFLDHVRYDSAAKLAASPPLLSLRGRNFEKAVFTDSNLPRADFTSANLKGASFIRARVQGGWFDYADLSGAQLVQASMQGASFNHALLPGANLDSAELQGASLPSAQLQGAWLYRTNFEATSLARADLRWAILDEATLRGANLYETWLQGASLRSVRLQGASFEGTHIWRTDFRGAQVKSGAGPHRLYMEHQGTGQANPPCFKLLFQDACDAKDVAERIRHLIERYVLEKPHAPENSSREQMLTRLQLDLKSPVPLNWEEESKKELNKLSEEKWNEKDDRLVDLWHDIACAGSGAPFILISLVNTMNDQNARTLPRNSTLLRRLIREFLDEGPCAAQAVMTNELKMRLRDLERSQAD